MHRREKTNDRLCAIRESFDEMFIGHFGGLRAHTHMCMSSNRTINTIKIKIKIFKSIDKIELDCRYTIVFFFLRFK